MNARQSFESTPAADAANRAQQTLGSIAVELPGATAIFRKLKLDFCCHGNVSLHQAAQDKNLDLAEILAQLAKLDRSDVPTEAVSPSALIDHILTRYHEVPYTRIPRKCPLVWPICWRSCSRNCWTT
jgi:regulator of cell morphogenesis and NO signaling